MTEVPSCNHTLLYDVYRLLVDTTHIVIFKTLCKVLTWVIVSKVTYKTQRIKEALEQQS